MIQNLKTKLDLYGANPKWYLKGRKTISSAKTILMSICILGLSVFLSFSDIQQLWVDISQTPVTQAVITYSDLLVVDPFMLGFVFYSLNASNPINSTLSVNTYFTMIYYNRTQVFPSSCTPTLLAASSNMICYRLQATKFTELDLDDLQFYVNSAYYSSVGYNMYYQETILSSVLSGSPKKMNIYPQIDRRSVAVYFRYINKYQISVSNSLVHNAAPTIYSCFRITQTVGKRNVPIPFTFFANDGPYTLVSYQREDITIILGSFLGYFTTLAAWTAVLFVLFNILNVKLSIAQRLFSNKSLQETHISFLFTLKFMLVNMLDTFSVKCRLFKQQSICFQAFNRVQKKLSAENILLSVRYIICNLKKQERQIAEKKPENLQEIVENKVNQNKKSEEIVENEIEQQKKQQEVVENEIEQKRNQILEINQEVNSENHSKIMELENQSRIVMQRKGSSMTEDEKHSFSYNLKEINLQTEANSELNQQQLSVSPAYEDKIQNKNIKPKYKLIKLFLKAFDMNPRTIEFDFPNKTKTSWRSIIITYVGITLILIGFYYFNLFQYTTTTVNTTTALDYQQFTINSGINNLYFSFYLIKPKGMALYTSVNTTLANVAFDMVDENNNVLVANLPYYNTSCGPGPQDPVFNVTRAPITFCFNQTITISNKGNSKLARLRLKSQLLDTTQGTLVVIAYAKGYGIVNGTLSPVQIMNYNHYYSLTSSAIINVDYYSLNYNNQGMYYGCSMKTVSTFQSINKKPTFYIYFTASTLQNAYVIKTTSILDLFQNVFGLSLIFLGFMANYLALPLNTSRAQKFIKDKYRTATDNMLETTNLLVWIQSKLYQRNVKDQGMKPIYLERL